MKKYRNKQKELEIFMVKQKNRNIQQKGKKCKNPFSFSDFISNKTMLLRLKLHKDTDSKAIEMLGGKNFLRNT